MSSFEKKKEVLIVLFPAAIHSAPTGKAQRSVSVPVFSRSSPATAEDLADGLETGSPYLHLHSPDIAFSRGGSLCCSFPPLRESALLQLFFSKETVIVFISEWRAEAREMDASHRGGEADMESFGPGSGGSVCDLSDIALSPLVLSDSSSSTGAGCYGIDLAEALSVRLSPIALLTGVLGKVRRDGVHQLL